MDHLFPFGKNKYLVLLCSMSIINMAYYVIVLYQKDVFPLGTALTMAVMGYSLVLPALSALIATLIAIVPLGPETYKERWFKMTLILWFGLNAFFVVLMLVIAIRGIGQ